MSRTQLSLGNDQGCSASLASMAKGAQAPLAPPASAAYASNQKCTSVYTYLTPNMHFTIQKQIVQVLVKPFLSIGKALRFYIQAQTQQSVD